MATLIRMPEIAANTTSASIVSWSVKEGDTVAAGDCLAEIESEKAVVELEAEQDGVLGRILVQAGSETDVGAPIAVLLQAGELDVDALLVEGEQGADVAALPAQENEAQQITAVESADESGAGRIAASPIARRLAQQNGISLSDLAGSGPQGRIVKRDVLAAGATMASTASSSVSSSAASSAALHAPSDAPSGATRNAQSRVPSTAAATAAPRTNAPAAAPHSDAYTDIPHTSMRRTIARRLSESKATIPHFYLRADCRMDALLALRAQVNAYAARKISVNDLIVKVVAAALRQTPDMNVSWTDDALRRYQHIDISVAVSTDNGLITPVIRDVDTKLLSAVSTEIADLAERARTSGLEPQEYQGGSFTISNLGMFGVREFAAIINPPQAAILAVGAIEQRAVVVDGELAVVSVMTVTLSVDHRAIDGAVAAQWLDTFKRILQNPALALV